MTPDFLFDDRRKRALVSGDVEVWIKNLEAVRAWRPSLRTSFELIGTVGERIALERLTYRGELEESGAFEGEFLRLTEVDDDGRISASLAFDPEDRAAAFAEAQGTAFAEGRITVNTDLLQLDPMVMTMVFEELGPEMKA